MWGVSKQPGLQRSLIWRALDGSSMEHCEFRQPVPQHIHLDGMVISVHDTMPFRAFYMVECDQHWHTRLVRIGYSSAMLELLVRDGRWFQVTRHPNPNECELLELEGCVDVDLGLTPATNTLPIRRLNLEIGQAAHVTAAWVKFPSLKIAPLQQRYERLSERTYKYSSPSFETTLEVDEFGLVVRYENGWERIASG